MSFIDTDLDDSKPKAVPTWYNGVEYRSKLEAKTAQAFDNLGIEFEYEKHSYMLPSGVWYRPDFWLPDTMQFVECKGVMNTESCAKILGLAKQESPVVVLNYQKSRIFEYIFVDDKSVLIESEDDNVCIIECARCSTYGFYHLSAEFECRSCGAHGHENFKALTQIIRGTDDLFGYSQKVVSDKPLYQKIVEEFNN